MAAAYPHVAMARRYMRDVLSGRILACQHAVAACIRQEQDLKAEKTKGFGYRFDKDRAEKVCRFISLMPHIKGPKARARELIVLEPWQAFILTTAFGWVDKRTGFRRFRRVYIEVPRGNAKSTLSSGVGLYMLTADGEAGPEVYSAATTRDQAKIVFGDAQKMIGKRPDMARQFGLDCQVAGIICAANDGQFTALSRDGKTQDGLNIHFACLDEVHAHKTREVYDVVETGAGKRDQSMIWAITTAGSNRSGICYELRSYMVRVLNIALSRWKDCPYALKGDTAEDDQLFGLIYTLDDGDDWTDPEIWKKANPNWGVSVMPDYVAGLANKAMQLASAQNNFKTKHLDLWVNANQAWMDMLAWGRCADPSLRIEDFADQDCIMALDLASKVDLAVRIRLFQRKNGDETHYYVFAHFYLPQRQVDESGNAQYEGWVIEGRITATAGDVIDFDNIEADIQSDVSVFDVRAVAYDPWQATQLSQRMTERNVPMQEYRQTVQNFSEPMKELEALVLSGRLHHDGDPVLAWCMSNVVCHTDAKDNVYPRKERVENKIDGAVALIMAIGMATAPSDFDEFVYEGM
ncbi:terminase large subunit [Gluconobacter albidus]|uniref:Terminase n=1 Tax=Gluconobacter albidus TaxID=318683 RepID=A0AAW3QWY5_9PROT|nr:terminase TerL endonuclease subunit [Gluconobacter albidus]KXV38233.1 terminase [Gluconobacter albidus]GBQ93825.1 phage terminase-like protein [Gluconobacter albidus NBRC 3250]GLQ68934.1 terminase [Gluconobacter albidus]